MADKYLELNAGNIAQKESLASSAGAGDAGKIVALDGTGRIHDSMMPVGIGADTKTVVASEALAAGNFVNIWNDSGTAKVRKADATTNGKPADGFVLSAVNQDANALVYFEGVNTQLTGMTIGATQFLSTTPGLRAETVPSGAGNVVQKLGRALSATELTFEPQDIIVVA